MEFAQDQASSKIELDDGRVITKCEQCQTLWQERSEREGTKHECPCATCKVDLLEENDEAASIYMLCQRQVILNGVGEVIDLKFEAVKAMMDLQGVKNQRECFAKVYKTFHHFLKEGKK